MVLVLCNIKPLSARGLSYRGLLLCARTLERLRGVILPPQPEAASTDCLELLLPPPGAIQGEVVTVEGYPYEPCLPFLDQHSSMFSTAAEPMKINNLKQAVYNGIPLRIHGRGCITSNTLTNCQVSFE